jgi:hypothetical protein
VKCVLFEQDSCAKSKKRVFHKLHDRDGIAVPETIVRAGNEKRTRPSILWEGSAHVGSICLQRQGCSGGYVAGYICCGRTPIVTDRPFGNSGFDAEDIKSSEEAARMDPPASYNEDDRFTVGIQESGGLRSSDLEDPEVQFSRSPFGDGLPSSLWILSQVQKLVMSS